MADYAYTVLSALAIFLNIAPFCWQLEHRNSGPVCLGFWVIVLNLNNFINAIVWRNDAINRAPAWCDLSSKISLGGPLGLLAANVCVTRFLARVVQPNGKMITARDRRNRAIFDYCFCFGVPIFVMATHVLYQPLRFGISKTLGCQFAFVISWPTFVLWMVWSPILALVAAMYAIYVIYQLLKHRRNFGKLLSQADSALTTSRFVRLVLLSAAYALFTLPLSIYQFTVQMDVGGAYVPYNYKFIHRGVARGIIYYAALVEHAGFVNYTAIISGILVLVFFGFSSESLGFYARIFRCCARPRSSTTTVQTSANTRTEPDYSLKAVEILSPDLDEEHASDKAAWKTTPQLHRSDYEGPFADTMGSGRSTRLPVSVMRYETVL